MSTSNFQWRFDGLLKAWNKELDENCSLVIVELSYEEQTYQLSEGDCDTFGYAYGEILSFENQKQMLIPRGFAHGYLTLEDDTLMQWCVDNDFCAEAARAVRYDSDFIWQTEPWPMREYVLSEKDENAIKLSELRKF